ncbi:MAG: ribonuclease III [Pontimonas sp.]
MHVTPPPPRIPPPGTLTEEEEDLLGPLNLRDVTPDNVEEVIGIRPVNIAYYVRAFTHPSSGGTPDYEVLEFLGDAVLGMVVARYLFDTYPDEAEGFLTITRTKLTRSEQLHSYALALGLQQFVYMSGKSIYRGYHQSKKVLEDIFESVIGAIYLDHGLMVAKQFILDTIETHTDWEDLKRNRNYKDILMREQHQLQKPLPTYVATKDEESRLFHVTIDLNGHIARGCGKTKKKAEQHAAKHMLQLMGVPVDD